MDCVSSVKNNESEISQSSFARTNPKSPRARIRVVFEFTLLRPKLTLYRGVQGADGGFRMERRGAEAKAFKTFMWTGSEEGLYSHLKSIEWCHGKHNVSGFSATSANK